MKVQARIPMFLREKPKIKTGNNHQKLSDEMEEYLEDIFVYFPEAAESDTMLPWLDNLRAFNVAICADETPSHTPCQNVFADLFTHCFKHDHSFILYKILDICLVQNLLYAFHFFINQFCFLEECSFDKSAIFQYLDLTTHFDLALTALSCGHIFEMTKLFGILEGLYENSEKKYGSVNRYLNTYYFDETAYFGDADFQEKYIISTPIFDALYVFIRREELLSSNDYRISEKRHACCFLQEYFHLDKKNKTFSNKVQEKRELFENLIKKHIVVERKIHLIRPA